MAHGTSAYGGSLSRGWTDSGQAGRSGRGRFAGFDWRIAWVQMTGERSPFQLPAVSAIAGLILGLMITAAWPASGLSMLHLAAVIAAGTVIGLVALRPGDHSGAAPAKPDRRMAEAPGQLLAQLHHELRTPLNAVIGFSEVMLREMHGPLGNVRYQEYAAHISESGGRLLKASEDALAVATTMSALIADRRALKREKLLMAAVLAEAWAASGGADRAIALKVADSAAIEIVCDRQSTSQALQHLLAEAITRAPAGATVVARAARSGSARCITIAVDPAGCARGLSTLTTAADADGIPAAGTGLRLMLARSLLEMQGATLSLSAEPPAAWTARIVFPVAAGGQARRRKQAHPPSPGRLRGALAIRPAYPSPWTAP